MNVLIVNGSPSYVDMWTDRGHKVVSTFDEADVIQFTGGEDVTPRYYGEAAHPRTHNSEIRDFNEAKIFKGALANRIPMVGICRGGQFLNVMSGGRLYQHVDNHAIGHTHMLVDVKTGKEHQVTSTHHQMMRVGSGGELVAYADSLATSKEYMLGGVLSQTLSEDKDTEVVWYEHTKCLCFQPHPEFHVLSCTEYFFEVVERYIKGE